MQPNRFRTLERLFNQLVDTPAESRDRILDQECGEDHALRAEVEAMLRSDGELGDPTIPAVNDGVVDPLEQGGATVGPYRIRKRLAQGGMGVVYEAEQYEPIRRSVALKLIRAGLDSERVIRRFELERHTLALMDHPNVARVYDAGTSEDGRPYFAMELVDGIPITEFCVSEKLSLASRLELFAEVCDAVHHAHQKGVIHRDLKPSNVLVRMVDGKPCGKVIDFGIAKAVDSGSDLDAGHTAAGDLVGTPEYMSPEQADPKCRDIDTRSDIYSLGILLYEMLAGAHPFRSDSGEKRAIDEMLRCVKNVTPERPSTRLQSSPGGSDLSGAVKRLRGDLDWIVLRAIEKERDRRYGSAADFGADIRRHLNDEPVLAGPPSAAYRFRKFVRRHRMGVAVSGLLLLTLIGGGLTVSIALFHKDRAEEQARRDADIAQRTTEFLMDVFEGANLWSVGSETPTVNDVTDRAAKDLTENRSLDAETRATLMRSIGQVYVTQNRFAEARPLLEESVDLFRNNPELSRVRYGRSLMRFSQLENYEGNYEESFRLAREAEHAVIEGGAGQAPIRGVAASILGANLLNGRQRDESREASTRAVDVFRSHGAEYERELATALMNLARCTEDAVQAAGFATEAIELYERTLPADHPGRAEGPKFLADQNYYLGDYATAAKYQGQAVEALRRLLPLDHWNVVFPVRIQAAYLLFAQQLEPARAALEEVAEAVIAASGESDIRLGGLYNDLAFVGLVEGDFEAAEAIARRSREILEAVVGREHLDVALTIHTLADILADRGEHDAALTLYDETRRIRETLGDLNSDPYAPALFEAYARLHRRTGDLQRAEEAIRRAIELYEQSLYIDTRVLPRARVTAATIRALLGDREGAAEAFDAAWSALAEAPGPLTMYDARQLTLYHAVNGDPVALAAALRTALDSGARPAFLLTEPELARRVRGDLALVALLTDD